MLPDMEKLQRINRELIIAHMKRAFIALLESDEATFDESISEALKCACELMDIERLLGKKEEVK